MTRLVSLLACLAAALAASAAVFTDTVPPHCDSFVYILRVQAPRTDGYNARIAFGNGSWLTFQVPSLADAADGRPHSISFELTDSAGAVCARRKGDVTIDPAEKGFGLRLSANAAGLAIALGGPHEEISAPAPGFDTPATRTISAVLPDGSAILRRSLRAEALDPPTRAGFGSVDDLAAYLAASTDPREGIYRYLDKDISPDGPAAMSRPEGYEFAIVRDPADPASYIIITLKNAAGVRTALDIKARMTATPFIGHFELRWTDAHRRPLRGAGTYAQFNENSSILTLAFPALGASFRLARAVPAK